MSCDGESESKPTEILSQSGWISVIVNHSVGKTDLIILNNSEYPDATTINSQKERVLVKYHSVMGRLTLKT